MSVGLVAFRSLQQNGNDVCEALRDGWPIQERLSGRNKYRFAEIIDRLVRPRRKIHGIRGVPAERVVRTRLVEETEGPSQARRTPETVS